MVRLRPFFPKSHGKLRVDDRRVLSGIVFVNRNGLRWRDAPKDYGPHKTLYNRWKRWGEAGVFTRMMEGLAAVNAEPRTVMIDATYLKAHRTASSGLKRGSRAPDRPHPRRHEHQAPCRYRRERPSIKLLHDRRPGKATTPARPRCSTICPRHSGCSATAAMTPTGSGTLSTRRASYLASRVADRATSRSDTISAATGVAAASRSSSAA